jgi:branched-chain amino acid transport system permease protein
MGEPTGVQQNLGYTQTDDFITTTYVLPLLRDNASRKRLIEEHRKNPIGVPGKNGHEAIGHSEDLARVLDKFRRRPMSGKYVIVCRHQFEEYFIGVCSGVRGESVKILEDEKFGNQNDVEHAIFLKRIDDLLAEYEGR